jgi:hypothetical protein
MRKTKEAEERAQIHEAMANRKKPVGLAKRVREEEKKGKTPFLSRGDSLKKWVIDTLN